MSANIPLSPARFRHLHVGIFMALVAVSLWGVYHWHRAYTTHAAHVLGASTELQQFEVKATDMTYTVRFYKDARLINGSKLPASDLRPAFYTKLSRANNSLDFKVFPVKKALLCQSNGTTYHTSITLNTSYGSLILCRAGDPEDHLYFAHFRVKSQDYTVWLIGPLVNNPAIIAPQLQSIISSIKIK